MKKIFRIIILLILLFLALFISFRKYNDIVSYEKTNAKSYKKIEDEYTKRDKELKENLKKVEQEIKKLENNKNSWAFPSLNQINKDLKNKNEEKFNIKLDIEKNLFEKEINKNKAYKEFKNKILNKSNLIKENWVWYWYFYRNYKSFWGDNNITQKDLEYNNIDKDKDLITYSWKEIIFVKDFKKYRLVSDHIIYWLPNKEELLRDLLNIKFFDKRNDNLDKDFLLLKRVSERINRNLYKKDDIIKNTYKYILENLKYDENIVEWNYNIFSWVRTFKDKIWVCQWYVELFSIMLWFNNIKSEVIKWDVVNSTDFPKVWHAWAKIDDFYYDPTFDDPIWAKKTRKFDEYYYYKMPKDIFYTNRFNFWETPNFLKKLSLDKREMYVDQNIYSLYDKYKDSNYNILNIVKFKKSLWLSSKQEVKIEDIIKKHWYYRLLWKWRVIVDWRIRYLQELNYFNISNENIANFIHQINFNFKDYKIFKTKEWKFLISNSYKFR